MNENRNSLIQGESKESDFETHIKNSKILIDNLQK